MPQPDGKRNISYIGDMKREGKIAESVVKHYLENHPKVRTVIDLSEDKEWQLKDVDFKVILKTGETQYIEAKSDKHIAFSKNFPFELNRINHRDKLETSVKLGWTIFSVADRFVICPSGQWEVWLFTPADVRKGFHQYMIDHRPNRINSRWILTDNERTTQIILVPTSYMPYRVMRLVNDKWQAAGEYKVFERKTA